MLKVDLIFSKSIYGPTGDCTFVRSMWQMKDKFAENGICLRLISPDLYIPNDGKIKPMRVTWKHRVSLFLTKYSALATRLAIYLVADKRNNSILNYYDRLNDKGDVVAFQDFLLCYNYLKRKHRQKQIVQCTIHGPGNLWAAFSHNFPKINSRILASYRKDVENTINSGCDNIGFDADRPRMDFCFIYPYEPQRTYYAYNGIPFRTFPLREKFNNLRLICVATLNNRKNQMGILNAIEMLPDSYQDQIQLIFVGNGDCRNLLEEKAEKIKSKVKFTGTISEPEYYKCMLESNCFILFSKNEGMPIAVLEAMRSGLPVIGSRVAGIPEQIEDGKTGFVVDLDEKQLAEVLRKVIDNKDELPKMGEASYNLFLEKFTIEAMVYKYSQIFKS